MYSQNKQTDDLLQRHYRWLRFGTALLTTVAGLIFTLIAVWWRHPYWQKLEKSSHLPVYVMAGCGLSLLAGIVVWFLQRQSLSRSAQKLDDKLSAKNRLEAALDLSQDQSALARAQREETDQFLGHTPVKSHDGLLAALGLLVLLLTLAHLTTLTVWTRPWQQTAQTIPKTTPKPVDLPQAKIEWKTPESETKANPIEEVPLEAVATSTTGLNNLVLEIQVNGTPKLNVPIAVEDLVAKGKHPIQTSLYLDQLEVQPFDIVSYHLRAQRIDSRKLPETVSPVQFVQVKPLRDDVREIPGGSGGGAGAAAMESLKAAQLRLIKQNFLLAHTDLPKDNPEWAKENQRVGNDQGLLEKRTGEAVQKMITDGAPAEIVNLITQAQPLMTDAAKKIRAKDNNPALNPQGKALGLITEVEKFFTKVTSKSGSGSPPPKTTADPFKDKKNLELKQRFETLAGQLEKLAAEQKRLADDLAKTDQASWEAPKKDKPDPNLFEGTITERQTQISQQLGTFLNGKTLVPEVTTHLEQGQELAKTALRQLDAEEVPAAREPASSAARELQLAVELMRRTGDEKARKDLADIQQKLNEAAEQARTAPQEKSDEAAQKQAKEAAQKAQEAAAKLAEEAKAQQETGSAEAAEKMMALAKAIQDKELQDALKKLQTQPKDQSTADQAAAKLDQLARQSQPSALSQQELAKLIEQMKRMEANMQRLANNTAPAKSEAPTKGNSEKPGGQKPGESQPPGKSPSEGKGDNPSQKGSPSEGKGNTPGKQDSPSEGKGEAPGKGQGETKSEAPGEGQSPSKGNSQSAGMGMQFALQLLNDVRTNTQGAALVIPDSPELAQIRTALTHLPDTTPDYQKIMQLFKEMDPSLKGLISQLSGEMQTVVRKHQLTAQELEVALPLYRTAVSDYFEQLSQDYPTDPASGKTP